MYVHLYIFYLSVLHRQTSGQVSLSSSNIRPDKYSVGNIGFNTTLPSRNNSRMAKVTL